MGTDWIKKQKREKYYKQAQKDGLRSRAAYKLRQIQEKYKIIKIENLILDLCCAPGSWIEELKRQFGDSVSIIGVDLVKMNPIEGVKFIQGDIRDENLIDKLKSTLSRKFDVIISDCAPKLTGMRETDYERQIFLVERVIHIASHCLIKNGHIACKLFDGNQTAEIRDQLKQIFNSIHLFKPKASRKKSIEIYFIGKYYKKS
jgi:23S rRNA (uridine2552-2'-O)-methyltransferase